MNIQIFNSIVEVAANWKNILFFLVVIYSLVITALYFKAKVELTNITDYYQVQMLILQDYYRADKKQTRIKFYERYVEEKEKLVDKFKTETEQENEKEVEE